MLIDNDMVPSAILSCVFSPEQLECWGRAGQAAWRLPCNSSGRAGWEGSGRHLVFGCSAQGHGRPPRRGWLPFLGHRRPPVPGGTAAPVAGAVRRAMAGTKSRNEDRSRQRAVGERGRSGGPPPGWAAAGRTAAGEGCATGREALGGSVGWLRVRVGGERGLEKIGRQVCLPNKCSSGRSNLLGQQK